ncbi:hypothetical protein [Methylocystis sp. S23]
MNAEENLDLSQPVQTRDGRPVTLWERRLANGDIVGVIHNTDGFEWATGWTREGRHHRDRMLDLVSVPREPVMRSVWASVHALAVSQAYVKLNLEDTREIAERRVQPWLTPEGVIEIIYKDQHVFDVKFHRAEARNV